MLDLSPLSIIGKRRVDHLPPHFHVYSFEVDYFSNSDDSISNWIEYKLKGRYSITSKSQKKDYLMIGFEEEKELTYFMLACPEIRR